MSECSQESYFRDGIFLWRTVIFRAQLEADGLYRPASEDKETHEELIQQAHQWLTEDSQDLRIVVHLAGLDYEEFRDAMEARYGPKAILVGPRGLDG